MDRAGLQIQIGSRSASPPCLPSGGVVCRTLVPSARANCSPRSQRIQSTGGLQFCGFRPKLSKCRVQLARRGYSVVPRSKLEELSPAEVIDEKESANGSGGSSFLDRDVSSPSISESAEADNKTFDWLAQWYPVGVLKHLDKRQPHPVTILGRDLVMWWDPNGGQWQVFADVCPHRLAPLSEGRINEQGHLQCSYHGWSFAPSTGACTLIPQAPEGVFETKDPKRSCATAYLVKEQQGLLWVYMDPSAVGKEPTAAMSPPFVPVLSDPEFCYDMGMSDLSYSYEALIENLLDPAHVPFAHHSIQGNRSSAKPLEFRVRKIEKEGFMGQRGETQIHNFVAPCLSLMDFQLPPAPAAKGHPWAVKVRQWIMSKIFGTEGSKRQISTAFFCVPTVPGKSRVFFAFPRNFAKTVFYLSPRWWNHLVHMKVLDSDMYLLHLMERRLEDRGGMANIEKLYYTPTKSDAFVVAYRSWLKKFGGSVPDYGPKAFDRLPPSRPKTESLDRSTQHVAQCTICSGALRNLRFLESVLQVLPLVLVGLVAASNIRPLRGLSAFSIPLICAAVVCSLASRWLTSWIKKNYEFHDYNHALVK